MNTLISLDYQSRTPIYEQIINQVIRYVSLGIYKPEEQILSIRELATMLGINPNTVRKAYGELENRGVIVTVSTKGTFIAKDISDISKKRIDSIVCDIQELFNDLYKLDVKKDDILKHIK